MPAGRLLFVISPLSVIGALSHRLAALRFLLTDFFWVDLTVFRHDITSPIEFAVGGALFRIENKYYIRGDDLAKGSTFFEEMERHLLSDETPSRFLSSQTDSPALREYPFHLLKQLQSTPQSPLHHPEGSAWNHTLLVVDEAAKVKEESSDPRAFMWAALLHDIGKPSTTARRKGKITSYDHDKEGAKLTEEFLRFFTADTAFIERVTQLVRYHMQILFVGKNLPFADVQGMKQNADIREIALLGLCDRLGRKGADRRREEENIRTFMKKANCIQEGNHMKPNPDNRADNVEKIRHNMDMTIENIHRADEMIEKTSDEKLKRDLKAKNERRIEALGGMRREIRDEANAAKNDRLQ